jgi:hypothetical protein
MPVVHTKHLSSDLSYRALPRAMGRRSFLLKSVGEFWFGRPLCATLKAGLRTSVHADFGAGAVGVFGTAAPYFITHTPFLAATEPPPTISWV